MYLLFLIAGAVAVLIAVFSYRLGLDHSPEWGRGRTGLLIIGLILLALSALAYLIQKVILPRYGNTRLVVRIGQILAWLRREWGSSRLGVIFGVLVCAGIGIFTLWYSSAGQFPVFPGVSNAYIDQGESFLHGQLSLLDQPDPRLLALRNPYDLNQRQNIPYRWDASLYQGKYYLYWGPAPALIFAAIEGVIHHQPPGSLVVILSYLGLSVILLLILLQMRERFYPNAPNLSSGLYLAAGLVNLPFLFLLGQPRIYETSIITGQFFLLFGLLAWILYTGREAPGWLIVAGLNWGLAVASRYNLIFSAAVFVAFALIQIVRKTGWKQFWQKGLLLLGPLALCAVGLGIYNLARFGNPLETGFSYALTIPESSKYFYSTAYVPGNLYVYLFNPYKLAGSFPFVKSYLLKASLLPAWLHIRRGQLFDEVLYGLFPAGPVFLSILLAVPITVSALSSRGGIRNFLSRHTEGNFLLAMTALAALSQLLFLSIFFYSAMRYLDDLYLLLILGAAVLVWQMDEMIHDRSGLRLALWLVVSGLILWTVGLGFFGSFDIPPQYFRLSNPSLYVHLASYWNNLYAGIVDLLRSLRIL